MTSAREYYESGLTSSSDSALATPGRDVKRTHCPSCDCAGPRTLKQTQAIAVQRALAAASGVITKASKLLGVPRQSLQRILRRARGKAEV